MSTWFDSLRVYREPRLLAVLFMGFASGLPLALTGSILSIRLTRSDVMLAAISVFTLVGIPYSLKFLWAPFIDRLPLPWPLGALGRRRGWAILMQSLLVVAILALGMVEPARGLLPVAILAVVVAFLSASQDIVIDAYRIELLRFEEQPAGALATQYGYRFGVIAASAGALYVNHYGGWIAAHAMVAGLMFVGIVTVALTPEPAAGAQPSVTGGLSTSTALPWLRETVVAPFREFLSRTGWAMILGCVMLYKFGDSLVGVMANPFYVKLGFSDIEIANISKIFGSCATLVGFVAGGVVIHRLGRFGLYKSMLACGILQMMSNLLYAVQALFGHDPWMLALTIGVENFTGAMGSVVFITYMSVLCNLAFTGTHYALLTSIATIGRNFLSVPAGWLAERLGWVSFFVLTTFAALPGLALVVMLMRRVPQEKHTVATPEPIAAS